MRKIKVRVYRRNPKRRKAKTVRRKSRAVARRRNPVRRKRAIRRSRRTVARRRNPVRTNRRRASVRRVSARRRNPSSSRMSIKNLLSLDVLKRAAGIGGGFILGRQLISLLTLGTIFGKTVFTPPAFLSGAARPFMGVISIVAGGVMAKKAKGKIAGDLAVGLIAAGGVDVITTIVNKVSPGMLGVYVNDPLSSFRGPQNLGLEVTATKSLGAVGTRYRVPQTRLQLNGSSFASSESSFD